MKKPEFKNLPLAEILESKSNPRQQFKKEDLQELADSIREKGVVQPIVVRQHKMKGMYEVVCGARRYRASMLVAITDASKSTIPVVVHELTDKEAIELQIIENMQRKDVHPIEEAKAYHKLINQNGFPIMEIAMRVGKSASYVMQRMKLVDLIEEFKQAFLEERINLSTASLIYKLTNADQQDLWNEECSTKKGLLNIQERDLNKYIGSLVDAPFDITDTTLVPEAQSCMGCKNNSASNNLLFPELDHKPICMNSKCFEEKSEKSFSQMLEKVIDDPSIVLIDHYYHHSEEGLALIKKGHKVYDRNYYTPMNEPVKPIHSEFEEAFADEEYSSLQEMEENFTEQIEEYDRDLKTYNSQQEAGLFLTGFYVSGSAKGKSISVLLKKDAKQENHTAASLAAKVTSNSVTASDIEAEIQRITTAENRKRELEEERTHVSLFEKLETENVYKESSVDLTQEEYTATLLALCNSSNQAARNLQQVLKDKSYDSRYISLQKKLATLTIAQLQPLLFNSLRIFILDKLKPYKGAANQSPAKNGNALALRNVATNWIPAILNELEVAQLEIRNKRNLKITDRISKLKDQLKPLKEKSVKKAVSKPSKKSKK